KNLEEIATAYGKKPEVAKTIYDNCIKQGGATAEDALKLTKEKFEQEFGFREETPISTETSEPEPALATTKPTKTRQLVLRVRESKELVHWDEGAWNTVISGITPDEMPLGRIDSNGAPIINEVFRIAFQRNDGQAIDGITSRIFSTKSKLYSWYSAILGREPAVGEDIDLNELVGR
ncbi:unnamed protein product, partial [marine sediment metagenome]